MAEPPVPTAVVRWNVHAVATPVTAVVIEGRCRIDRTRIRNAASALNMSQWIVLAAAT
jgi:hypothetical protein